MECIGERTGTSRPSFIGHRCWSVTVSAIFKGCKYRQTPGEIHYMMLSFQFPQRDTILSIFPCACKRFCMEKFHFEASLGKCNNFECGVKSFSPHLHFEKLSISCDVQFKSVALVSLSPIFSIASGITPFPTCICPPRVWSRPICWCMTLQSRWVGHGRTLMMNPPWPYADVSTSAKSLTVSVTSALYEERNLNWYLPFYCVSLTE